MIKSKKGVIYDLDGTIIATANLHEQAWTEAGRHLNIAVSEEFLKKQKGLTDEAGAKQVLGEKFKKHGTSFVKIKQDYVAQNTGSIRIYEDFLEAYKKLISLGIKVWVCTSSHREFVSSVYNNLPELQALTKATVAREMYKEGKPNPEPILLTAKMMGLPVEECIYVGDAYNDYLAATSAGCGFAYACRNSADKDPRIPNAISVISNHNQILSII